MKNYNMEYKVVCNIPTAYQYTSLCKMNLNNRKRGNGSYVGEMEFIDEEEAKNFLIDRAEKYYDDDEIKLAEAISDIENYGMLHIDAATARIEKIDIDEEE